MAAPSKLQRPWGDRVKTDAKDAVHLARSLRPDEVTAVAIPSVDQEAARDLVRSREDCRGDLMRARHRLSKLLLRHGIVYYDGAAWTGKHDRWLQHDALGQLISPETRLAFDSDYEAVLTVKARRDRLDVAIAELAADSEFTSIVQRLGCLRGVSTLTGFAPAVEIGDWHRFTGATIGSFVGLVPSEYSSGASRSQGAITKTGNTHVRRLLVEAGWHHRARYVAGAGLRQRWALAPAAAQARGTPGTAGCTTAGWTSWPAASGPPSRTSRSPVRWPAVLVAGRHGPLAAHRLVPRPGHRWWQRVEQTRDSSMSNRLNPLGYS